MSTDGSVPNEDSASYRIERIIASIVMAWVVILTTYMILQNQTLSPTSMYFLKIILSLSGAVMLATLPGFLDINYSLSGFSVRAAGGAAAFVFIYTQSPSIPALKLDPAPNPPIDIKHSVTGSSGQLSNTADGFPVLVALSFDPVGLFLAGANKESETYAIYSAGHGESGNTTLNSNINLASLDFSNILMLHQSSNLSHALMSSVTTVLRNIASRVIALLDMAAELLRAGVDQVVVFADDLVTKLNSFIAAPIDQLTVLSDTVEVSLDQLSTDVIEPVIISVEGLVETVLIDVNDTVGGLTDAVLGTVGGVTQQLTGELLGVTQNVVEDVTGSVLPAVDEIVGSVTPQLEKITHKLNEITPALVIKLDENLPLEQSLILGPERVHTVAENVVLQPLEGVLERVDVGHLTNLVNDPISFSGQGNDLLAGPLLGNISGPCNALGCATGIVTNVQGRVNEALLNRQSGAAGGLVRSLLGGGAPNSGPEETGPGGGFSGESPIEGSSGGGAQGANGGLLSSTLKTTSDAVGGLTNGLTGRRKR